MPENSLHNTEVFKNTRKFITVLKVPKKQMLESSPPNAEVFKNKHQRIHHSAESAKNKRQKIHYTTPKVFKNKHQKLHDSGQGQMLENLPHNAKGVQEQTPKNSLQFPRSNAGEFITQYQRCSRTLENSSQYQKCQRTNAREFTTQYRKCSRTNINKITT
ncbi:907_t:CDS:2 [Gigaspora margarita]|uniref:907_t:CDS:1 n=1 Tax=Gigaspora margarita TaxID=4874 RepID=A0ABN7V6M4_GIGMA|nr:907_t:CDS:2 [Gigaspora margarita]